MYIIKKNSRKFRLIAFVCAALMALSFAGCKKDSGSDKKQASEGKKDKVVVVEKFFHSQIMEIYTNEKPYLGKEIELEGMLKKPGKGLYAVLRNGPGCCGNDSVLGFEVKTKDKKMLKILKSGKKDAWIKASGILKKYKEDGKELLYLELKEAKILKTRGKETVKAT